jgi:hypothetical protein
MRERGEHYPRTEGQDFPLAPSAPDLSFPTSPTKFGWNGAPLAREREMCNPEETTLCPNHPFKYCRGDIHMIFSVGIGRGADVFDTDTIGRVPVMTGQDVTDIVGLFVADPFLVARNGSWYIFAEIVNNACQKGEIGIQVSEDEGQSWRYGGIVLAEDWHLSFPFVVELNGDYFMTTSATAGTKAPYSLWLYKAADFPRGWNKILENLPGGTLVGRAVDPVLYLHNSVWFLLLLDDGLHKERIFLSDRLYGPYIEHPASKKQLVRHAGRFLTDDHGMLYAFHQFSAARVEAVQILKLSPAEFEYGVGFELLQPRAELPWATAGMHSINTLRLHDGSWVVVVDGWRRDEHLERYRCLEAGEKDCPT